MFQGMEPLEVILSKDSSPYTFRTQLEWCIVGLVDETVYRATVLCSKISVQDMSCKTAVSHYFAMETEVKDVGIRQMLHRIYAADLIDHCSSKRREDFHSYFFMFSKTSLNKNCWKVHRFEKKKSLSVLILCSFKVGLSPSKKNFFCFIISWKPFKNDGKCILFHLKSSFHSQCISVFDMTFCSCRKNGLVRKIRLVSKFMASEPVW